jgi:hypothetical protein
MAIGNITVDKMPVHKMTLGQMRQGKMPGKPFMVKLRNPQREMMENQPILLPSSYQAQCFNAFHGQNKLECFFQIYYPRLMFASKGE